MSCVECYRKSAIPFFSMAEKADLLIVLGSPNESEYEANAPFVRGAHRILAMEFKDYNYAVVHAYGCPEGGLAKRKDLMGLCARKRVEEAIALLDPQYVLMVGKDAYQATLRRSAIMKDRGNLTEKSGITFMPTVDPEMFAFRAEYETLFLADVEHLKRVMKATVVEPPAVDWCIPTYAEMTRQEGLVTSKSIVTFDIETTGLNKDTADILLFGCKIDNNPVMIFPIKMTEFTDKALLDRYDAFIDRLFTLGAKVYVGHNASAFDVPFLRAKWYKHAKTTDDTLGIVYLLNENLPHDLKWEARTRYGVHDYAMEPPYTPDTDMTELAEYCARDIHYTYLLYKQSIGELDPKLLKIYKRILMPVTAVLQEMEEVGVKVDRKRLHEKTVETLEAIDRSNERLNLLAGQEINWSSPDQVRKVLYEDLKMPILNKSATGKPSTAYGTLKKLQQKKNHPILKELIDSRSLYKELSSFLVPWAEFLDEEDRMHPRYKPFRTVTGRLAAEQPNLQQTKRDSGIRSLIIPRKGYTFVEADYSQIELRIAAFIAQEPTMLDAYAKGLDIHTITASKVTNKPLAEVTKDDRTKAKAVNFGFLYGMWWKSFQDYAYTNYGVVLTEEQAQKAHKDYFDLYRGLTTWHQSQKREVTATGQVASPLGRIRRLHNIFSPLQSKRMDAERMAINFPVQSMASDICLMALINLRKNLEEPFAYIVGQVHDSILFEVRDNMLNAVCKVIKETMEDTSWLKRDFGIKLNVPIQVEIKYGRAWGEGKIWMA